MRVDNRRAHGPCTKVLSHWSGVARWYITSPLRAARWILVRRNACVQQSAVVMQKFAKLASFARFHSQFNPQAHHFVSTSALGGFDEPKNLSAVPEKLYALPRRSLARWRAFPGTPRGLSATRAKSAAEVLDETPPQPTTRRASHSKQTAGRVRRARRNTSALGRERSDGTKAGSVGSRIFGRLSRADKRTGSFDPPATPDLFLSHVRWRGLEGQRKICSYRCKTPYVMNEKVGSSDC